MAELNIKVPRKRMDAFVRRIISKNYPFGARCCAMILALKILSMCWWNLKREKLLDWLFYMQAELSEFLGRQVHLDMPGFLIIYLREQVLREAQVQYVKAAVGS
jgi:hypothetical protein